MAEILRRETVAGALLAVPVVPVVRSAAAGGPDAGPGLDEHATIAILVGSVLAIVLATVVLQVRKRPVAG